MLTSQPRAMGASALSDTMARRTLKTMTAYNLAFPP